MRRRLLVFALLLPACGDGSGGATDAASDTVSRPDVLDQCAGQGRDKIKFTREQSCANDGSVEWCIPDNDAQLVTALSAISSTIHCAPGGGRAGCFTPTGRLLCTYPTSYPDECLAASGEMKPEVWADMCAIAAQPSITEIVPTLVE